MSETAQIGDNQGPAMGVDELIASNFEAQVKDFAEASSEWIKAGEISDETQAEKVNDFITGARQLAKEVEKARKDMKQPFIDAGKEVDSRFKLLLRPIEIAMERGKALLTPYQRKKAEAAEKAKRAAEEKARKAAEEAAAKAKEAEDSGDAMAQAEAERVAEKAKEAEAQAARISTTGAVGSATGGGRTTSLRTYYTARIDKSHVVMAWLLRHHDEEMTEFMTTLLNREKRSNRALEVPGVTFLEEKR